MIKTIIKEAGIVVLLLIAIALILGIIFYDYIPNSKTIPAKVESHAFPEDIKEELSQTLKDEQNIVRTYYIDSSDLSLYESTKEYDKGKVNPFVDTSTVAPATTNSTTSANSNTTSTNTSTNTQANTASQSSGSTGTFFNKAGKF